MLSDRPEPLSDSSMPTLVASFFQLLIPAWELDHDDEKLLLCSQLSLLRFSSLFSTTSIHPSSVLDPASLTAKPTSKNNELPSPSHETPRLDAADQLVPTDPWDLKEIPDQQDAKDQ